jgi:hypothetical protein
MPSAEEMRHRKELAQRARVTAENALRASLPISTTQLQALFNYLDNKLTEAGCDDTLRFTKQFAENAQLPYESLKVWLAALGGYCDCEVLANVEEKVEGLL